MIVSGGKPLGFAPQALGETTPFLSNGYFYAQQGMGLANTFATYSALYRAQPSIMTLVDKIAASAARIPLKVWQPTDAGKIEDSTSAYAKLLANPCNQMSRFNFYRWTISTYEIYGEAFWYKQRRDQSFAADGKPIQSGPVVNLLPMHPSRVAVHRTADGSTEYVFTLGVASGGILRAPAEDVVAFLRYNPDNLMRGLSRLEGLRSTLFNEDAARRANASFWTRGARPGTLLTVKNKISQEGANRLKEQFDAVASGPDRVGSTVVLEEGMEAQIIQLTAVEMQYIESRKLNMQETCMVFDFPPPAVHILDHATFSNITEQMRSVYRDTMTPRFSDFESAIGSQLRVEFFADGEREARFDLTQVLQGDFETRVDKGVSARNSGGITGNEFRELIGMARVEDPEMDKIYVNAALVRLGTVKAGPSVAEPGSGFHPNDLLHSSDGKPAKGADQGQASFRSIMGRLSRTKGNRPALKSKLVDEHRRELSKYFDSQRSAVKAAFRAKDAVPVQLDTPAWNSKLADILHSLSKATTTSIGGATADDLDGTYDPARLADWLQKNAVESAANINGATADELAKAYLGAVEDEDSDPEDAIDGLFDGEVSARADQISTSRVAILGGLASQVAADQSGARTKTWVVTSANARPSHSVMDGETVGLNETFSNGMNGPGDTSGGADEVAGCTCDLEFSKEG